MDVVTVEFIIMYNREFLCKGLVAILDVALNSAQYLLG